MSRVLRDPKEDEEVHSLDPDYYYVRPLKLKIHNFQVSISFENDPKEFCPICDVVLNEVNQVLIPECSHKFCNSCIKTYTTLRIQDLQVSKMSCPQHTCKAEIPIDIVQAYLTPEFFEKYKKFKAIEELNRNPNLRWCPVADCGGYDTGSMKKQRLVCNKCEYNYCYYCSEAWHDGLACKGQTDYILDKWSKENGVKFCPNCTRRVQKNAGCDHMTCPVCKYEWCWLCGKKYHPSHYNICKARIMQEMNLEWSIILLLIFFIPITPFYFAGFCCIRLYDRIPRRIRTIWKIFILLGAFIFTFVLTPLAYIVGIYVFTVFGLNEISKRFTKKFIIKVINGFIAIPLYPIMACVAVISPIFATIGGFCALIVRIYFIIKKYRNPDYMSYLDYANF